MTTLLALLLCCQCQGGSCAAPARYTVAGPVIQDGLAVQPVTGPAASIVVRRGLFGAPRALYYGHAQYAPAPPVYYPPDFVPVPYVVHARPRLFGFARPAQAFGAWPVGACGGNGCR